MRLNELGQVVKIEWLKTAEIRDNVELDEFVVMPNHIHGIVAITKPHVGARRAVPLQNNLANQPPVHCQQSFVHLNLR
jgi:REP element-mobilizing transposase RayT